MPDYIANKGDGIPGLEAGYDSGGPSNFDDKLTRMFNPDLAKLNIPETLTKELGNIKSGYEVGRNTETKIKEMTPYVRFEVHEYGSLLASWTYGKLEVSDDKNNNATSFVLPLMPTDIVRSQSIRTDVHPTMTYSENLQPIATIDTWGHSVPQWSIKGHTGFKKRNGADGRDAFVSLCTFFENYQKENLYRIQQGKTLCALLLCSSTDTWQDMWYVEPTALPTKHRSADKPLMYYYDMSFVGVEMLADTNPISDSVTQALSDPQARLKQIARSMSGTITNLNNLKSFIPNELKIEGEGLISTLTSIKDSISGAVAPVKDFLITVNNTITDVDNFQKKLRNTIRNELSPVFEVTNQFNQAVCSLKTLSKMPQDFYSDIKSDLKNLANSVKGSGCGTTLRTGGTAIMSAGKVGFAGLYGAR